MLISLCDVVFHWRTGRIGYMLETDDDLLYLRFPAGGPDAWRHATVFWHIGMWDGERHAEDGEGIDSHDWDDDGY